MRRIDRYWKRCAAGVMAAVTLMLGQGGMQSFAMNAQTITSPNKIIVQDETQNTGSQANTSNQTAVSKAEVVGFGEVSTPVTDSSSYFGKGKLTLLANHDTAAQQLAAIIETGEGGLIVVDGGWTDNTDYVLNQIKAKGGHVQAWLITHPDSDHAGALADILYKHAGEITIDGHLLFFPGRQLVCGKRCKCCFYGSLYKRCICKSFPIHPSRRYRYPTGDQCRDLQRSKF